MKTKLLSVYDSKAEAYMQPFHAQSRGSAIRSFTDETNNPQSPFNRHPADYTLFELGDYDDATGTFELYDAKVNLGLAQDFINQ